MIRLNLHTQLRILLRYLAIAALPCLIVGCTQSPRLHSLMTDDKLNAALNNEFPGGMTAAQVTQRLSEEHVIAYKGWKWGEDAQTAGVVALLQQPPNSASSMQSVSKEIWLRFFFDDEGNFTHYEYTRAGVGP